MRFVTAVFLVAQAAFLCAGSDETISALRYGNPEAREAAIDGVLAGKALDAGPALLDLLGDSQGVQRLKVMRALGVVREDRAVKPVAALLQDPDPETRLVAARCLGRIGDPAAAKPLQGALGDTDEEVREAAIRALGSCGGPAQASEMVGLLKDKNRLVRLAAVDTLGQLGGPDSLTALEGVLGDADPSLKRHVVIAIGALPGAKVESHLEEWLKDKDPYLRGFAAEALSKRSPDKRLVPLLLRLLDDPVYAVRVRSVEALGMWRSKAAVRPLLEDLRKEEATFRWKAVLALGQIGDAGAKDGLSYLAEHDAEPEIRKAAAQALKSLH